MDNPEEPRERRGYERRRTDRLKSETLDHLVRGVAHDVNNVLGVILTHVGRIEASFAADDPRKEVIDALYTTVAHGTALSEAITMLSTDHALEHDLVDVDALIAGTAELIGSALPDDVSLSLALDAHPSSVVVLRGSLERVLLNGTLNAVRAMPLGGSLTISTRTEVISDTPGACVVIEVIDDGIGVDDRTRRRAFEPHFTTRRSPAGHGIGLTASRQLVAATGGSLDLAGAPGGGSILLLRYPVARPATEARRRRVDDTSTDQRSRRIVSR